MPEESVRQPHTLRLWIFVISVAMTAGITNSIDHHQLQLAGIGVIVAAISLWNLLIELRKSIAQQNRPRSRRQV